LNAGEKENGIDMISDRNSSENDVPVHTPYLKDIGSERPGSAKRTRKKIDDHSSLPGLPLLDFVQLDESKQTEYVLNGRINRGPCTREVYQKEIRAISIPKSVPRIQCQPSEVCSLYQRGKDLNQGRCL
jgi:hypothetical protein